MDGSEGKVVILHPIQSVEAWESRRMVRLALRKNPFI